MKWVKACACNACIEVARLPGGNVGIKVGASSLVLVATAAEWGDFVAGVKAGAFDDLDVTP